AQENDVKQNIDTPTADDAKAEEDAHADAWEKAAQENDVKQNIDTPTADDAKAEEDAHADAWEKAAQESMNKEEAMKDDATQESTNKEETMKGNTTQESMNQADTHTTRAQTLPETGQTHNSGLFGGIFLAIGLSLLVLSRRLNQR
ncbi:LPXTG cell wall anchor domain-containing protein, partial [Staphylococcus felis]|uniref:LPXTG cell wall anchor domain-containing protein n=1 Tax=Staphylococcus felis TaxID=46127 RepID=UPI000E22F32B